MTCLESNVLDTYVFGLASPAGEADTVMELNNQGSDTLIDNGLANRMVGNGGNDGGVYLYFTRSEMKPWIFLRLSPLPPQLIFQLYTFSTGGEG